MTMNTPAREQRVATGYRRAARQKATPWGTADAGRPASRLEIRQRDDTERAGENANHGAGDGDGASDAPAPRCRWPSR